MSCVHFRWQSEPRFDWSQIEARSPAISNPPLSACDPLIEPVGGVANDLPALVHGPALNTAARFCRAAPTAPGPPPAEMMPGPSTTLSAQD